MIPPNKEGRIHPTDSTRLVEFGQALKREFSRPMPAKDVKSFSATNVRGDSKAYAARLVMDGQRDTYWATDDSISQASVTLTFRKPHKLQTLRLREPGNNCFRLRCAACYGNIHMDIFLKGSVNCVAPFENISGTRAGTQADHTERFRNLRKRSAQSLAALHGNRSAHHHDIRLSRRTAELKAVALRVIARCQDRYQFDIASIAGTRIDMENPRALLHAAVNHIL